MLFRSVRGAVRTAIAEAARPNQERKRASLMQTSKDPSLKCGERGTCPEQFGCGRCRVRKKKTGSFGGAGVLIDAGARYGLGVGVVVVTGAGAGVWPGPAKKNRAAAITTTAATIIKILLVSM